VRKQEELSRRLSRPTTRVNGIIVPVPDTSFDNDNIVGQRTRLPMIDIIEIKQQAQQTRNTQERERVARETAESNTRMAEEQRRKQEEKSKDPGLDERQARLAQEQLYQARQQKLAQEQYEREAPQRAEAAMRALQEAEFQKRQAEQNQGLAQMQFNLQAQQGPFIPPPLTPEEERQRELDRQEAIRRRQNPTGRINLPQYLRHLQNKNYLLY
jgi:hypothetical protein